MAEVVRMPISDPWQEIERLTRELDASQRREVALAVRLAREVGRSERRRRKRRLAGPDLFDGREA